MDKRIFLIGQGNSLFKQLVTNLLEDMTDDLDLLENNAMEFECLLEEIKNAKPDLVLLEELTPFTENSLLMRLFANIPDLPVIVIREDSNLMHTVRCDTRLLGSSKDLIETINLISTQ